MSNASTIRRQIAGTQQLTLASLSGTTITTTATAFQLNNNALTQSGGGVIPLSTGNTGLYQGTGQVFIVRAAGQYSGATASSTTLALTLYEVPASVIANGLTSQSFTGWNAVGTQAAATLGTASGSFQFEALLQFDAAGNLQGSYSSNIDGTTKAQTVVTNIAGLVGEADLNFVLVAQLGTATSGVIVTLDEFAIDLL